MRPSTKNLQEMMPDKTDEELYDIWHTHSKDYTPEAVEAAREEFSHRQLDAPTLGGIAAASGRVLEKEEARLSWPLRLVAFLISTIFIFIPVLLAHRHFVEKGEKGKARDWARWAIYGLVFYWVAGFMYYNVVIRVLTSMGY